MITCNIEYLKIIASFATAIVAGVGIGVAYYNIKRQIHKNSIMEWVKDFRNEASLLVANTSLSKVLLDANAFSIEKRGDKVISVYVSVSKIKLMLDWNNKLHLDFDAAMTEMIKISDTANRKEWEKVSNNFMDLAKAIIDQEKSKI